MTVEERRISTGTGSIEDGSTTGIRHHGGGHRQWEEYHKGKTSSSTGPHRPGVAQLYDTITGIQYGEIDDPFGWVRTV